jgi:hypothetical protein
MSDTYDKVKPIERIKNVNRFDGSIFFGRGRSNSLSRTVVSYCRN